MNDNVLIGRRKLIAVLIILTPGIPEYLTGSSKLSTLFVNPGSFLIGLVFNISLYSAGVLLIREFSIRYRKGWGSILALGCAYGIMEEGIAVHTFFIANGGPAGNLAIYGRVDGVNWVWAFAITFFHAVFSVALPILLLKLAYPKWSDRSLLGKPGIVLVLSIYLIDVVVLNSIVQSRPSLAIYFLFIFTVLVLIVVASFLPKEFLSPRRMQGSGTRRAFIGGLLIFPLYVMASLVIGGTSGFGILPPVADILFIVVACAFLAIFISRSIPAERNSRHVFNFVIGAVIPLLVWAEIVQLIGIAPLITVVTVIAIYLLLRLKKMVKSFDLPVSSLPA